ncbi:hypothetical protein AB4K20DRAFT_1561980 [Rhizopus microsporus]|uniref:Chromatin modification-related protein n=1 Tax=Rhizopus microsporus TaxID=58291 RepID=A0A1X0RQ27_RHIZD|nr:hypothetical protein BCV71DRAFT_56070 [Rhizopus microsporus]
MTMSIADIFEEYVESLQNLPLEIDQNMHELRRMDEEFQQFRETYTKHKKMYTKLCKAANWMPNNNLAVSKSQLDKEYSLAIQKQDQKIDLTKKMYDLVSRHIERIDSQMAKSDTGEDWMGIGRRTDDNDGWKLSSTRKRMLPHSHRKRGFDEQHSLFSELEIDPNEPKYCYCNQVSFGDMIACDGENCEKEWFHYACVGLDEPPVGKWYCNDCAAAEGYRKKLKRYSEDIY